MAPHRKLAIQHNVPVKDLPSRISNRLIVVITINKNGIQSRDCACSTEPARSNRFASTENVDGGYPRVAGGSPTDNPISRCAIATRVNESIMRTTSLPICANHCAIRVAVNAARCRINAG